MEIFDVTDDNGKTIKNYKKLSKTIKYHKKLLTPQKGDTVKM